MSACMPHLFGIFVLFPINALFASAQTLARAVVAKFSNCAGSAECLVIANIVGFVNAVASAEHFELPILSVFLPCKNILQRRIVLISVKSSIYNFTKTY